jgi:hypothetical protein
VFGNKNCWNNEKFSKRVKLLRLSAIGTTGQQAAILFEDIFVHQTEQILGLISFFLLIKNSLYFSGKYA